MQLDDEVCLLLPREQRQNPEPFAGALAARASELTAWAGGNRLRLVHSVPEVVLSSRPNRVRPRGATPSRHKISARQGPVTCAGKGVAAPGATPPPPISTRPRTNRNSLGGASRFRRRSSPFARAEIAFVRGIDHGDDRLVEGAGSASTTRSFFWSPFILERSMSAGRDAGQRNIVDQDAVSASICTIIELWVSSSAVWTAAMAPFFSAAGFPISIVF